MVLTDVPGRFLERYWSDYHSRMPRALPEYLALSADEIVRMWRYVQGDEERFRKFFAFLASLPSPNSAVDAVDPTIRARASHPSADVSCS